MNHQVKIILINIYIYIYIYNFIKKKKKKKKKINIINNLYINKLINTTLLNFNKITFFISKT